MDISLRAYCEEIDRLIDAKKVDEAVAHCRHILAYYPKNLEAYRLLGKALLDKGRHGDAADVFQRVLSAVPDDFISHVGMAIVREDEANVDVAVWHMERAFETAPGNAAIQEELRRLYGRRDGVTPPKTRLTRGALARMYAQGELYLQAEAELKAALADDPARLDLSTILAQVYWHSDQRAQAADTCSAILQKLPYSRDANRILADIALMQGHANDAAPYRQRLEALDPYEAFAQPGLDGQGATQVRDDAVKIPKLDYVPGMDETQQPDWLGSLGQKMDAGAPAPAESAPDWLRPSTSAAASPFGESPFAADMPQTGDLPDWLQGMKPAAPAPAAPVEDSGLGGADWLSGLQAGAVAAPAAPTEMPDWMKGMPAEPAAPTPAAESPDWMSGLGAGAIAGAGLAAAEMPDWMKDVAPPAGGAPAAPTASIPSIMEETPDWLKEVSPAAPAPEVAGETPDWLKGIEPSAGAKPPSGGAKAVRSMTDWLKPPPGHVEPPTAPAAPVPTEEVPEWMRGAAAEPAAPEPATDIPAWMKPPVRDTEATAVFGGPAAPAEEIPEWMKPALGGAEGGAGAAPAAETPEWMRGVSPAPAEPKRPGTKPFRMMTDFLKPETVAPELAAEPAAEIPDWMRDIAPQAPAPPAAEPASRAAPPWREEPPGEAVAPEPSIDFPDWMKEAEAGEEPAAFAPPAAETPEWMRGAALQAAPPEPAAEIPDWMKAAAQTPAEPSAAAPSLREEAPEPAEIPDWMRGIAPPAGEAFSRAALSLREEAPGEAVAAAPAAEVPDWMRGAAPPVAPPEPAAEIPDWMKAAAETPAEPPAGEASSRAAPPWREDAQGAPAAEPAAEIPDWLRGIAPEAAAEEQPAAPAELPDWMKPALSEAEGPALSQEAEPLAGEAFSRAAPSLREEAQGAAQIPDWMRGAAETPAPATPEEPKPDWLKQMEGEADQYEASVAPPVKPPVELPDFLQPASPEALARAAQPSELAEEDWLKEVVTTGQETEEVAPAQPAEIPDWLKAMAPPGAAMPPAETAAPAAGPMQEGEVKPPEWIREPSAQEAEAPPADLPVWAQAAEPGTSDTIVHWLADKKKKVPDWLRQPGEEAPAPPADWLRAPIEAEAVPEEPATAAETPAPEAAEPDLASMSPDEALRWLESLALQQGGKPEEMVSGVAATEQRAPVEPEVEAAPPTPSAELPDWLKGPAAEIPTEPEAYAPPAETPAAPAAGEERDLASMSADEALRWLEGLAVQQGARPEELVTPPEERTVEPPRWVAEEAAAPAAPAPIIQQPEALEPEVEAALPTPSAELPDWLKGPAAEIPTEPEAYAPAAETPAAPAPGEEPDLASMSADEALRWLEGLAVQQGARPEELVTPPEERTVEPPKWVAEEVAATPAGEAASRAAPPRREEAQEEPAAPAEALPTWLAGAEQREAEAAPAEEIPEWLKPKPEPAPTSPSKPARAPVEEKKASAAEDAKIARLAEKLAAAKRAKEDEIAARFEAQRAEQQAARRAIQEKMEQKKAQHPGTGKLGTGPIAAKPEKAARPAAATTVIELPAAKPPPKPAPKPALPPKPKAPVRPRGKAAKSAYAQQPADQVLSTARQRIGEDDYAGAAEALDYLVNTGQYLDEIVGELEELTAARKGAAPLLQVLGDAYMKNNRLQKALDTYRKALEQL